MASNNLRILYNNYVDNNTINTIISSSSQALPVSNLLTDNKSLVWRSETAPLPTRITTTLVTSPTLGAVVDNKVNLLVTGIAAGNTNNITTNTLLDASYVGKPIIFSGISAGGININSVYYINTINSYNITISTTPNSSTFKTVLLARFSAPSVVGVVALPFCNLTNTATITIRGYTSATNNIYPVIGSGVSNPSISTTGCTQVFSVINKLAAPYSNFGEWSWAQTNLSASSGINTFSYGGGTYARVYVPLADQIACTSLTIEITDTYNTDRYIEAARLIIGSYWSPTYNTQYGLTSSIVDSSTSQRTDSGNLITNKGTIFSKLNFDLGMLTKQDRTNLLHILKGSGISKPLFVSLFPEDLDLEKESSHQIYGKIANLSSIQHTMLDYYSSSLEVEEI